MQICWKTPRLSVAIVKTGQICFGTDGGGKNVSKIPCKLTVWSAPPALSENAFVAKKSFWQRFFNKLALWLAFWLNITICLSVCWIVWKSPNIWHKWGCFYSKESCFHQKYRMRVLVEVGVLWKYWQNHWLFSPQLCSPGSTPFEKPQVNWNFHKLSQTSLRFTWLVFHFCEIVHAFNS